MRVRTRSVWMAVMVLVCALGAAATVVAADALTVSVTPKRGVYGTEVTVQPSIAGTVTVGDKIELYALDADDAWVKYGEGQLVEANEETGAAPVIEPFFLHLDESLTYPAVLRATYIPKVGTPYNSEPFRLHIVKNNRTRVNISAPASVKRGASFTTLFEVLPNSGVGRVRVTIKKVAGPGPAFNRTLTLATDEEGGAEHTTKLSSAGRYSVTAKFLGNTFGAPSATATRVITVR